jgi:hypothetical protein
MKWVREVDDLEDPIGTRHVKIEVLPMPSDPTKVAGVVRMDDPEPKHQIAFHRSGLPMAIDVARSLAWKIAAERGANVIWISDPKNLFPMHKRITNQVLTLPVLALP